MERVIVTGMLLSFTCAMQAMEESEECSIEEQKEEEQNKSKIYIGSKNEKILIKAVTDESGYNLIITASPDFYRWGKVQKSNFREVPEETLRECEIKQEAQYLSGEKYYKLIDKLCQKSKPLKGELATAQSIQAGQIALAAINLY